MLRATAAARSAAFFLCGLFREGGVEAAEVVGLLPGENGAGQGGVGGGGHGVFFYGGGIEVETGGGGSGICYLLWSLVVVVVEGVFPSIS